MWNIPFGFYLSHISVSVLSAKPQCKLAMTLSGKLRFTMHVSVLTKLVLVLIFNDQRQFAKIFMILLRIINYTNTRHLHLQMQCLQMYHQMQMQKLSSTVLPLIKFTFVFDPIRFVRFNIDRTTKCDIKHNFRGNTSEAW